MLGYLGPVKGYLDQRADLARERDRLALLEQRRDQLHDRLAALQEAAVLEARARDLGMVLPGEQAYLVRGELDPPPPPAGEDGDDGGLLGWITGIF